MSGLTKREAFAMAAMQGLLANEQECHLHSNTLASYCVSSADALLKELESDQT